MATRENKNDGSTWEDQRCGIMEYRMDATNNSFAMVVDTEKVVERKTLSTNLTFTLAKKGRTSLGDSMIS